MFCVLVSKFLNLCKTQLNGSDTCLRRLNVEKRVLAQCLAVDIKQLLTFFSSTI